MAEMSGSKALLETLKREKVTTIFGLPGGASLPLYDEVYNSDMRHILARHEQSAAHMADGYARASGRAGVCFSTSGPGATNLVTGIATAFMDSSPVVAITGQVARPLIGKDAFQEIDIIGISTPITKYNAQLSSASEIPFEVKKAFYIATTLRPGPTLIDFPKDVQSESCDIKFLDKIKLLGYNPAIPINKERVKKAAELISQAERPLILAGGGVIWSNAFKELHQLSEMLYAPVATSFMGKGAFPENHPLSVGMVGMHGRTEANRIITEADTIIAIALRFSDRTTGKVNEFGIDARIIHIDIDEAEAEKNKRVDVSVVGDAKEALSILIKDLRKSQFKDRKSWQERISAVKSEVDSNTKARSGELTAPQILKTLRKTLPDNAIVTTEVGQNQMWSALYFKAYHPRTFISSGGLGTMGFGFPASLGAKVAIPDVPVVDIAGDGSFSMTENSLATSIVEEIPVTVMILNNRMLGMVAQWQRLFYGRRYSAVQLKEPDFVKLAESYGAHGVRVGSLDELSQALKTAITSDVTTVIDIPLSSEEDVLPMIPPGGGLKDMIEAI